MSVLKKATSVQPGVNKPVSILNQKFFHPHCFPKDRNTLRKMVLEEGGEEKTGLLRLLLFDDELITNATTKQIIQEKNLKILSSGYGCIKHIFFTYPDESKVDCKEKFKPVFLDVITKLIEVIDDLKITVLAHDAEYVEAVLMEIYSGNKTFWLWI